jgi:hypothetical protein
VDDELREVFLEETDEVLRNPSGIPAAQVGRPDDPSALGTCVARSTR